MIKITVLYPNGEGSTFDMSYYCNTHIPMVQRLVGPALKGVSVDQGMTGGEPGSPPLYVAVCHLLFESVEAFQAAFGPPEEAIMGDIPNYTNIQPIIQVSEVKL